MFRDELDLFADRVTNGKECELSAANGCQAVAAFYAALRSAREDSRIVPLSEIIDAAQAELAGEAKRRGAAGAR